MFNYNATIQSKQLTMDGHLLFKGITFSNALDAEDQQLIITPNAFKVAEKEFIESGGPIKFFHNRDPRFKDRVLGRIFDLAYYPENFELDSVDWDDQKIFVTGIITDPDAVKMILSGEFTALSLGFQWHPDTTFTAWYDKNKRIHTSVKFLEVSLCKQGVNPDSRLEILSTDEIEEGKEIEIFGYKAKIKSYDDDNLEIDFGLSLKSIKIPYKIKSKSRDSVKMSFIERKAYKKKVKIKNKRKTSNGFDKSV